MRFAVKKEDFPEEWRAIPDFPDYEASDLGYVRRATPGRGTRVGNLLKQFLNRRGYPVTQVKRKTIHVHRLVLSAFVPMPRPGMECNHKNGVKTDNRLRNLEWTDRSGNMKHAYRLGLKSDRGERNGRARLTKKDVERIRSLRGVVKQVDLAIEYGVCSSTISHIQTGRNWK